MPRHRSRLLRNLATTLGPVLLVAGGLALAVLTRPSTAAAEGTEATKKVVRQNERVRAQSNYYPAGASVAEHEHASPRIVVVIEGGTLEVRDVSGRVSTLSLKNGDIVWRPPEKHSITNVGSTPVRLVEIDVLDCPKR